MENLCTHLELPKAEDCSGTSKGLSSALLQGCTESVKPLEENRTSAPLEAKQGGFVGGRKHKYGLNEKEGGREERNIVVMQIIHECQF